MANLGDFLQGLDQALPGGIALGQRGQALVQAQREAEQMAAMRQQQMQMQQEQQRVQQFQMLSEAAQVGKDYFTSMAEEFGVDTGSKRFKSLMKSAVAHEESERAQAQMFLDIAKQSGVPLSDIFDPEKVPTDVLFQGIQMTNQLQQQQRQARHEQARLKMQEMQLGLAQQQEARLGRSEEMKQQLLQGAMSGGGGTSRVMGLEAAGLGGIADIVKETSPAYQQEVQKAQRTAQAQAPLPPSVAATVGLPPGMTVGQAEEMGLFASELAEDPKVVREVRQNVAATNTALKEIAQLSEMIDARSIGLSGSIARGIASASAQMEAIAEGMGISLSEMAPQALANHPSIRRGIEEEIGDGPKANVIRSRMADLAYSIASAREGGKLSTSDVEFALQSLGNSGDPESFRQTLTDLGERLRYGAAKKAESTVGMVPMQLRSLDELEQLLGTGMDAAVNMELKRRLDALSTGRK